MSTQQLTKNDENDEQLTKNDVAWIKLFEKHQILSQINQKGCFEIESNQINQERESRLMAKFDHFINLPKIFKENNLSILPISRSKYVIGRFQTYFPVKYNSEIEPSPVEFPANIESIDYTNLYSEASALNCAFNTGIIDDLLQEETFYTVSGRMSTERFEFSIENSINSQPYLIKVENSQCEIDGGFESKNYFLLIEVKNYAVDDFLIRQLYYPYRLWSAKISKKVIPILMTYSNDIFSFFIFEFENALDYNSLKLVTQKNYIIAPEELQRTDVEQVWSQIQVIEDPPNVPFPQANNFDRVVDLLSLLVEKDLTKNELTENYQFDTRQTDYYTNAGLYMKLIKKYKNAETSEITFCLTNEARSILGKRQKLKYIDFIHKILEHEIFYRVFQFTLYRGEIPSKEQISEIISEIRSDVSGTTIKRRASTVRGWIEWIWKQIKD